jgi:sugar/nucleoside kinase (ribokinase family)
MVLSVGEILADMIGEVKDNVTYYERKAGGAPFNVACAISRFGGSAGFIGTVGDDLIGKFLYEFANKRKLDYLEIQTLNNANTTLAFVELSKEGERSFCFYRKNTADYQLQPVSEEVVSKANIVHIGSLMLSHQSGVDFAVNTCNLAHKLGKMVSFDVNFRTDIFRDLNDAVKSYKIMLEKADIVKFSEDEVEIFTKEYVDSLTDKLVFVTLGKRGAEWRYKGEKGFYKTTSHKPIDTTGAGDAFYGGALSMLDKVSADNWTSDYLTETVKFANVCGALNTQGKGAIDNLPTLATVLREMVKI